MYAYCMNNPINRIDVSGNWSWKALGKVVAAVATVVAVTAVCVATAGAAALAVGASTAVTSAVVTGATVGGLAAGGANIVGQCSSVGAENLDVGEVVIKAATGSAYGAASALKAVAPTRAISFAARAGVVMSNTTNTLLTQLNRGASTKEALESAGKTALCSVGIQAATAVFPGNGNYGAGKALLSSAIITGKEVIDRNEDTISWMQRKAGRYLQVF